MSNSDWRKYAKIVGLASAAFLALALIYGAGYFTGDLSGYYAGDADRAANQYPGDTQRMIDDCFKLPSRPATVKCVSEASASARENQRAEKDLVAQQDMADWAWWVMVIGVLQFFATIATLGFVKLTLDATLEAVKDTGDATKAMLRQNELTEATQRPWLSVTIEAVGPHRIEENALHIGFQILIKNSGPMPAHYVSATIATEKATEARKISFVAFSNDVARTRQAVSRAIAPNGQERFQALSTRVEVTKDQLEAVRSGRVVLPLIIGCTYFDGVTNQTHYAVRTFFYGLAPGKSATRTDVKSFIGTIPVT